MFNFEINHHYKFCTGCKTNDDRIRKQLPQAVTSEQGKVN